MKRKRIFNFSWLLFFFFSTTLYAAEGPYLQISGAVTSLAKTTFSEPGVGPFNAEFDNGSGVVGGIGYDFGKIRLEEEVAYRKNSFDAGGAYDALSLLINGFCDIEINSAFSPYLLAGIGFAQVSIDDLSVAGFTRSGSQNDTVFAYQLGAGVAYDVNEILTVDLGFRFFMAVNPDFNGVKAEYKSNNILLGLRFNF
ncbi:outer membrane protein [Thermodesulfobacteriota bacterium]